MTVRKDRKLIKLREKYIKYKTRFAENVVFDMDAPYGSRLLKFTFIYPQFASCPTICRLCRLTKARRPTTMSCMEGGGSNPDPRGSGFGVILTLR